MVFLAKYLGFLFKNKKIACLLKLQIPTKAKVRFSWSNPHMQFDFALSFVKFFDPCYRLVILLWSRARTHPLTCYTSTLKDSKHDIPTKDGTKRCQKGFDRTPTRPNQAHLSPANSHRVPYAGSRWYHLESSPKDPLLEGYIRRRRAPNSRHITREEEELHSKA